MRRLRGAWRLLRAVLHGLHGVAIVLLRFPSLDRAARRERVRWWAAKMLRVLGIRLVVQGQFKAGAKMLVANHISWLDIMVVHAVCPEARFVSKAEVRHWPLVGRLVDAADTLYIERQRKRDAMRVVHDSAAALRQGDTVAVFPEGTTGTGHDVMPFHANLLQAAIATEAPVQPVVLRYRDARSAVSQAPSYVGDTSLLESMWSTVTADKLVAEVIVENAQGTRHADRRALAEHLRETIVGRLQEGRA